MAGFNVPTGPMTPELLAQIAAAGFRPPGPAPAPGLHVSAPQTPGFNVGLGEGMAGLAAGLQAALKGMGGPIVNAGPQGSGLGRAYTTDDAMRMAGAAGLNVGMPEDENLGKAVAGINGLGGVGAPDFLTGIWRKLFG